MSALASEKKTKGYLSFKEIAHFRFGMKDTEKGKAFSRSYTLISFEKEDGITFSLRARNGSEFSTQYLYKLKLRRNKKGEARFVFYKVRVEGMGERGVRTVNPNHFRSQMVSLCHKFEGNRKRPIMPYVERNKGLYKAQARRMRSVILAFLKKHNVSVKGLSKDPFSMMVQLCYPGTLYFKEETLRDISTGSFLLDDPVKLVMRTKGKLSKKLVYQAIEKFPKSTQTLLKFARYVRVNRSLDDAQRFIQTAVNCEVGTFEFRNIDSDYGAHSIKEASAKRLRVLDRIPTEQLARDLTQGREVCDTFNMLAALNQDDREGEGFNVGGLQYRSIRELHDAIIDTTHFSRGKRKRFTDYEFDPDSNPMKFCQILLDNFKDDEWKVYFAKNTVELRNHSEKFHNCSFGYHGMIKSGNYAIFCLDSLTSNGRYMFGVSLRGYDPSWYMPPKGLALLGQAVGVCNRRIEDNRYNELCQKIQKAVPNFQFASRCTASDQPVLH